MGLTAQEQHDIHMQRLRHKRLKGSRRRLEHLLASKGIASDAPENDNYDWVGALVRRHPGLTPEKVAEMAEAYGFCTARTVLQERRGLRTDHCLKFTFREGVH